MQTQLIRYFLALEREAHFGRAAATCNVSQPTLSAGIATLETQLGKRLIMRDRKFTGLTAEGKAILPWARQMIAALDGMTHAVETAQGALRGELRLGAIPAAMPATGLLISALQSRHPQVEVSLRALTSRQIERDLAAFELDAGLTYLDFEPPAQSLQIPLYTEHYLLAVAKISPHAEAKPVEWQDVARLPLCLLPQSMQNRRILDSRLAARGMALRPLVTADSYIALLAIIQQGRLCTIIPDSHASLLHGLDWINLIPLPQPQEGSSIGVVVSDRNPLGKLSAAVLSVARTLAASDGYASMIGDLYHSSPTSI